MAIAQHHAGVFQRFDTGVGLHAAAAQRYRRAAVDRHVDVVVAWAVLVVVVDVEGVVTRLARREGRPVNAAALAPGLGSDQLAAHGDCQTVVGRTREGVALAGFQVDQARRFRAAATGDAAIGLHVGRGAAGVRAAGQAGFAPPRHRGDRAEGRPEHRELRRARRRAGLDRGRDRQGS